MSKRDVIFTPELNISKLVFESRTLLAQIENCTRLLWFSSYLEAEKNKILGAKCI